MSSRVVAVVPVRAGTVVQGGDEVVAEALDLDDDAVVLLVGGDARAAAAGLPGAERVTVVERDRFAPGEWAAALAPLVEGADVVLLPGSPDGRDLAPRLAATLGQPLLAAAMSVGRTSSGVVVRAVRHSGLVERRMEVDGPCVVTLQPGVRVVAAPAADRPPVLIDMTVPARQVTDAQVTAEYPPDAATMDLAEADRIVGGGAGLMGATDPADVFARLRAVGAAVGASMGATRVVTDAGWVRHERQIGTTGVVVDPRLYLAFGISGAVQHTAGLGRPDHVISVNLDPHCPMMGMADLAIVADAVEVLAELSRRLGVGGTAAAAATVAAVAGGAGADA